METTTLKIKIPVGFEVDSFDKISCEIKLRETPKNVIDRIKTIDDVLADNKITSDGFKQLCEGFEEDEVAYVTLKLLTKSLNEGWLPDWNNSSECKYYPWFDMLGSSGFRFFDYGAWLSPSSVGSRLCFKTRALAEYAGKQFTNVYEQFMIIK